MGNKYARMFIAGGLKVPEKITKKETFKAVRSFDAPKELICRSYNTPVENQGNLPYCAAYAASSFAENLLWRRRHYHSDIDPVPLYKYAKSIDGDPDGGGTYLECTMEALLVKDYFDKNVCKIKQIGGGMFGNGGAMNDVKFAIHRYGICMAGFGITSEWFYPRNNWIKGDGKYASEGGHAVCIVGYNEDGFLILNSWGKEYADGGYVWISNDAFKKQFIYACTMTHVLDD